MSSHFLQKTYFIRFLQVCICMINTGGIGSDESGKNQETKLFEAVYFYNTKGGGCVVFPHIR